MMQQPGDRSPREDDQRAHEDPEPSGADQPPVGASPGAEDRRGTPAGMTSEDVEARSDIARFLGTSAFPGTKDELLAKARENQATAEVLGRLGSAPAGPFQNMQELARAIGIGTEEGRQ